MYSTLCFLWRVERLDGTIIAATDHDEPVVFRGDTYSPTVGITTTKLSQKIGLETDNIEVQGSVDGEVIKEKDIEAGLYDGASVDIFIVDWSNTGQYSHKLRGKFGNVYLTESGYTTEVYSKSNQLSQASGRTYQRTCDTVLGSPQCGVNLNNPTYSTVCEILAISDQTLLVTNAALYDSDWFSLGELISSTGQRYRIKTHTASSLELWNPPSNLRIGELARIVAGCRQTASVCSSKFQNIRNFRGFNLMPGNDSLIDYPIIGYDDYTGGSIFSD